MKRITSLLVCLVFIGFSAIAQDIQISGKVTNPDDGSSLPGVSIVVKGTTIGTNTNIDGEYSINVPTGSTLVFSFIGMKPQEIVVGNQTLIDVGLEMESTGVEEVVVTALGITKDKKALGYAVSDFGREELDDIQIVDATHALQGKAAGVSISPSSGAPGASTRVIVRGLSSVTQSNQPLYVIDGVPISNEFANANSTKLKTTANRTVDFGNAASDINPNDIASISILKGAAATSLYGSRAANGVVMITTKSAKKTDKVKIDFSSSASIEEVARLPYYQKKFGQGWSGQYSSNENGSWGPAMDGEDRLTGNVVDNSQRLMPFSFQENGLRDFYEYGFSATNTISISGGNKNSGYYISYANTQQDGVAPTDVDYLKRNSVTFKTNSSIGKTNVEFSGNFTSKKVSAIATGQGDDAGGGKTLFQEILQNPVNHYIPLYKDYNNKFDNLDNYFTPYAMNPYFIINENGNDFKQNRYISSLNISRDLMEGLNLAWRGGLDHYTNFYKDWGAIARITPDSYNSSDANDVLGSTIEEARTVTQLNSDLFLRYNNEIDLGSGILEYSVLLGNNINQGYSKRVTTISKSLVVPEYYNVQNLSGSAEVSTYEKLYRTVALFGNIDLNYENFLFLQLTARNDWSSTLPKENNGFFYPGANLGFAFSELMPANPVLSWGKLRVSYALAGNSGDPYRLETFYVPSQIRAGGFGFSNYPIQGVPAYEQSYILGNPNLKNELSKEFEIGADLRFFNNRIGIDFAYYKKVTTDLIFNANIAASSGFWEETSNLGQISNTGIELMLSITPVKTQNFSWDITYIFNKQNSVIDELNASLGVAEYVINTAYETDFVAIPGEQLGMFRVPDYQRTDDGKIVVGDNGIPLEGGKRLIGSSVPDFETSLINSISYKGLSLSFLWHYSKGGYMYSYTSSITYWSGNNEQSTINDRRPWVIPNTVQEVEDEEGNITYVENSIPIVNTWDDYFASNTNKPIEDERIIDKTYIKLRELTLSYSIPSDFVAKARITSAKIGVYGRNLFLWTPADNSFIDPETSTYGNDIVGMFGEFGGSPSVRSYGIKLNLSF